MIPFKDSDFPCRFDQGLKFETINAVFSPFNPTRVRVSLIPGIFNNFSSTSFIDISEFILNKCSKFFLVSTNEYYYRSDCLFIDICSIYIGTKASINGIVSKIRYDVLCN